MGDSLERSRLNAETWLHEGKPLAAAHEWDGMRALARLVFPPDDPRKWVALSRTARSLAEDASGMHGLFMPSTEREFRASAAASLAAGALESFRALSDRAAGHSAAASGPAGPAPSPAPGPDGVGSVADTDGDRNETDPDGEKGGGVKTSGYCRVLAPRIPVRTAETNFAKQTLKMTLPFVRHGGVKPAFTFGEAFYPTPQAEKAAPDPFPSARELRSRLAAAEAAGGPEPRSREAELVLRSLLGMELWDSGGRNAAEEATELLKEAASGLEKLSPRGIETLLARERLARRLAGMSGFGRILPGLSLKIKLLPDPVYGMLYDEEDEDNLPDLEPKIIPPADLLQAKRLFAEIERLALPTRTFEPVRLRASVCVAGLEDIGSNVNANRRPGPGLKAQSALLMDQEKQMNRTGKMPDPNWARAAFDLAEFLRQAGEDHEKVKLIHLFAINVRRNTLGALHPETASTLSRLADLWYPYHQEQACEYWALALEAVEWRGERYEPFTAELEYRLGRALLMTSWGREALPALERAERRFRGLEGETGQRTLECGLLLAHSLYLCDMVPEAEKLYSGIVALLDGAPPREDPDPDMSPDETVLFAALAGAGAMMKKRGDTAGGEKLLRRAAELEPKSRDRLALMDLGCFLIQEFLN
jgi:hypothetical protein